MEITPKQPIKFYTLEDKKGVTSTLKKIKKFLTKKRWIQDALEDAKGGYCLLGASEKINGPYENDVDEIFDHEASVRGYDTAVIYNDHPRRTHEQIVGFLESCINRAEKGRVS